MKWNTDQIKLYRSELCIKLDEVKKSGNQSLHDEIDGLKKNLQEKDDIIISLKTDVDQIKNLTNLQSSIIKIGSAVGIKIKPAGAIQACIRLPKGKKSSWANESYCQIF